VDFQPLPIVLEPLPDLRVLMIGSIVLNEDGAAAAIVGGQSVQEVQIGGGIENRSLPVVEAGTPEFDGAQDLHILAFAGDGDLGRMAHPAPGRVQRGILPETGLVGKNQRPVLAAGFFLRRG